MNTTTRNSKGQFIKIEKIILNCKICNKIFEVYPSDFKRGRCCCSRKCGYKLVSIIKTGKKRPDIIERLYKPEIHITEKCKTCGREFNLTILDKEKYNRKYCSRKCKEEDAEKRKIDAINGSITSRERGVYKRFSERMKNGGAIKALCGNVKQPRVSNLQLELFNIIKKEYPDTQLEYIIKSRSLDIAIPSLKLDIEYDGEHWHKNKDKDIKRDDELLNLGWKTIRVNKYILKSIKKNGLRILNLDNFRLF